MIRLRKSGERGRTQIGWLDSRHTFSFGDYMDPSHHHFRHLRVINEDWIEPGQGFDTHSHRDMEILTYIIEGALQHRDSMGNQSVIKPHEIQKMSAGTGVTHSEFNASDTETAHLLQIWIFPDTKGLKPGYAQKYFPPARKKNKLLLIASPDEREGSILIHQDVLLLASLLETGKTVEHTLMPGRHAWLQVVKGRVAIKDIRMDAGDGAAIADEKTIRVTAKAESEILLFDLN